MWSRYLGAGVIAIVAQQLVPPGLVSDVAYGVIGASSVIAIVVGVRRNWPVHREAWYHLAAGLAAWVIGTAFATWSDDVSPVGVLAAGVAGFHLAAYPLFAAGLWILVRSRGPERLPTVLIDSAIITVAVGLLSWLYRIEPAWTAPGVPLSARLVAVGFPLGGVLFVAMLVRLAMTPWVSSTSSRLLWGAIGAMLTVETLSSASNYVPFLAARAQAFDPLWLLAYVLWGACALHPSMGLLSARSAERDDLQQARRQLGLAGAALTGPAVLMGELTAGVPVHAWAVSIATVILVLLVYLRMDAIVRHTRRQSDRLKVLADTDYVTGLANLRWFADALGAFLGNPGGRTAAVYLLDLERFTKISDTLGDRTGDVVLRAVGDRLRAVSGPAAIVARTGEHAFAVLDPAVASACDLDRDAAHLQAAMQAPYELAAMSVSVQVNVGYLMLPDDGGDVDLVLHRADVALAAAKVRPAHTARYAADLDAGNALAPLLIGELRGALDREEVQLHYQPQVDLATGRVFGVEALARWQHPRHGLLGPDLFIPTAERVGLIGLLTKYVLDRALAQNARWRAEGLEVTVAVNLSGGNLLDPGLVDDVRAALERHHLDPHTLELEITEGTAMVDPRRSLHVLTELAEMGVILSIDDYGTGYSSLAYLQRLPVHRLKIDRSFVTDIRTDPASAAIVASTIELARLLHLDVIAEGVEDDLTLRTLRDLACPAVQGFGVGRPAAAPLVPALIRAIEDRLPAVLDLIVQGIGPIADRPT